MRTILLFLFITFSLSISEAQFSTAPDSLTFCSTDSLHEHVIDFQVINDSSTPISVWWKIKKDSLFPKKWEVFLCDINLCYTASILQCPASKPNIFPAKSDSIYMLHFNPDTVGGFGHIWIEFYSDKNFTNLIYTMDTKSALSISNNCTSGVSNDQSPKEGIVYPNPFNDRLNISGFTNYENVFIYDLLGRQILKHNFNPDHIYDLSQLKNGLYILNIVDKNKTLLTRKIVKE